MPTIRKISVTVPSIKDAYSPMKVGLLTGGGDCPGLNAVIRGSNT